MIKRNQQLLNAINVMSDMALLVLSFAAAWFLRYYIMDGYVSVSVQQTVIMAICICGITVLAYGITKRYQTHRFSEVSRDVPIVIVINAGCSAAILAFSYIFKLGSISRLMIVFFWIISSILVAIKRVIMSTILRHYRSLGFNLKHVVLVGTGPIAQRYYDDIRAEKYLGFYIDGFVGPDDAEIDDLPHLCTVGELKDWLMANDPDEMIVALEYEEMDQMMTVIDAADHSGIRTSIIPFYANLIPANPVIETVGSSKIIGLNSTPLDNAGYAFMKRAIDIIGGCILVVLTSPLMLFAAIGVKLSSPGPVFFKQERIGRGKKPFMMLKFRSMRVTATEKTGWSTNEDPRKTKFGSFIRKFSIDELPQFINVIKGDMSLVGPRPEVPFHVDHFKDEIPLYLVRQQVRPGITGWAQILGLRGDTSIEERIKKDIYYIENWSLWLDFQILLKTVFGAWKNDEKIVTKANDKSKQQAAEDQKAEAEETKTEKED